MTPRPSPIPAPPRSWTPATPSGTKDISELESSHPSANQQEEHCSNGRRNSTPPSTRSATSSNAPSPTSRPGDACTPTTADLGAPTPKPSALSGHSTSSSSVLHKPQGIKPHVEQLSLLKCVSF